MKNNEKTGLAIVFFIILIILVFFGIIIGRALQEIQESKIKEDEFKWPTTLEDIKIQDNKSLYKNEKLELKKLYVTVMKPQGIGSVTLSELNENINITNEVYFNDVNDPFVDVVYSENPIEYEENTKCNATMEIRGQSSRRADQKSYKIKIKNDDERWNGFKIINLNKHYYDALRIKNKLSFDLFKDIDNITSFSTDFVELYIRDLSQGENGQYKSYGVYTFIEQPNKEYLKRHNLDPQGDFYKAEFFEFKNYEGKLKDKDDPLYNNDDFESILETRGRGDHSKIMDMVNKVNDYKENINHIVNEYFDEDNMLTWVAANILLNNYDTTSRNFMLYSPLNSEKWFFIPWDYDGSWRDSKPVESWQSSLSLYWGTTLFNRYFRYPENVKKLNRKIEEVYKIMEPNKIREMTNRYLEVIGDKIYTEPDLSHMKNSREKLLEEVSRIPYMPENNRKRYYDDLQRPMPFFLWECEEDNGKLTFTWENSFDLQDKELKYKFILSTDPKRNNVIKSEDEIKNTTYTIDKVQPGKYYWSVVAYDSEGNWRLPFDYYRENPIVYYGVKEIEVK